MDKVSNAKHKIQTRFQETEDKMNELEKYIKDLMATEGIQQEEYK